MTNFLRRGSDFLATGSKRLMLFLGARPATGFDLLMEQAPKVHAIDATISITVKYRLATYMVNIFSR